jgi:hypothetical protein
LFKAAGDRRGYNPAERLAKKGEFVARIRNRIDDGSFARDLLKNVGIVSLSRSALNILMWSHYADYHRGFVLEFRIPVKGTKGDLELSTDRLLPFRVTYQANRPRIDVGNHMKESLLEMILLTKSLNWQYEEEERVLDKNRPPGIFRYRRDDILCSVIAGVKMNKDNIQRLRDICQAVAGTTIPTLKVFQAVAYSDSYDIHVPDHPRLARTN